MSQEVADFKAVTHSDATNNTLVVDSVTEDIVYYCVATVKDANGDSHLLRSNTVAVKKVGELYHVMSKYGVVIRDSQQIFIFPVAVICSSPVTRAVLGP